MTALTTLVVEMAHGLDADHFRDDDYGVFIRIKRTGELLEVVKAEQIDSQHVRLTVAREA